MVLATRRPAADWATVSAERAPPEPPPAWLITVLIEKYFHPYHFTKIRVLTLYDQAAFVRFVSRVDHSRRSRVWRVLSGRSGAVDWSEFGARQRRQPAGRPRSSPRRDVCGPRCWKLAASRARVGGSRSWGLGLHLPILPYLLDKFKDSLSLTTHDLHFVSLM